MTDPWISVDEQLPEPGDVLVWDGTWMRAACFDGGIWWATCPRCIQFNRITNCTHWMPLPDPPKGEAND